MEIFHNQNTCFIKTTKALIIALACVVLFGCGHSNETFTIAHDFTNKPGGSIFDILPRLDFDQYTKTHYLGKGWSIPETTQDGGTFIWSVGKQSLLRFYVAEYKDLNVTMKCMPLPVENEQQSIDISINKRNLTKIHLDPGSRMYAFTIPKDYLMLGKNTMTFTYAYNRSPQSLNLSEDRRELGVNFASIDFEEDYPFKDITHETLNHIVNISRMQLGDKIKIGIVQNPQSAFVVDKCYIPPHAFLKFSLGFHPAVKEHDTDVTFSVFVREFTPYSLQSPEEWVIFSEALNLKDKTDRVWKDYTVDLSEFAGKVVSIAFNVLAEANPDTILAMWGEPKIYAKIYEPQYNVFLLTMDALRSDHVGCYGYHKNTTPNIDIFSQNTVKFKTCYSVAPATPISFGSYYTALYPQSHKVAENQQRLHSRFPTPPTFLKPYGYFTQVITTHPYLFDDSYGFSRDFDSKDADRLNTKEPFHLDTFQRWLMHHKDEKFFLHIHFVPPHAPYAAVAPYDKEFIDFDAPILGGTLKLFFTHSSDRFAPWQIEDFWKNQNAIKDPEKRAYIVNLYDANLALADEFFGKIIEQLKKDHLYNTSLIIFSADHGEQFWEHDEVAHGSALYNEILHIPLLVKFPDKLHITPQEINSPVLTIDLLPTILAVNGIPIPEYFQGKSFFDPKLKKLQDIEREYTYLAQNAFVPGSKGLQGVLWKTYKYIYSTKEKTEELYDLEHDLLEQHNIALEEPETLERLRGALENYGKLAIISEDTEKNNLQNSLEIDEETLERLRDLGYVQ